MAPTKKKVAKKSAVKAAPKAAKATKEKKAPKPLSDRQKAFQAKHADAVALAKGVKAMEHNHGLLFIMLPGKNSYVVGRLSASGKSFNSEFKGGHDEALEFYRGERSGSYGKESGGKAKASKKSAKVAKKSNKHSVKKSKGGKLEDEID